MMMTDAVWRRHANPFSVYSRFTVLPLLSLAIWSRDWIGPWAWLAVALGMFWNWFNPRAFLPVSKIEGWASQGVWGERIFLNRTNGTVAKEHAVFVYVLSALTGVFSLLLAWGLWELSVSITVFGLILAVTFKTWTFDRMVWIYRDGDSAGRDFDNFSVS